MYNSKKYILNLLGVLFLTVSLGAITYQASSLETRQLLQSFAARRGRSCEDLGAPAARQACRRAQQEAEEKAAVQPPPPPPEQATPTTDLTLNQAIGNTTGNNPFNPNETHTGSLTVVNVDPNQFKNIGDKNQESGSSDITLNELTGNTSSNAFVSPEDEAANDQLQNFISNQINNPATTNSDNSIAKDTSTAISPFANVTTQAGSGLKTKESTNSLPPSCSNCSIDQTSLNINNIVSLQGSNPSGEVPTENGNTYYPTNLERIYSGLNEISNGAFGNYVQYYQDVNAANPDIENDLLSLDYYSKAVTPEGLFNTETFLANAVTLGLAEPLLTGRDIITEKIKYSFSQLNPVQEDTFYLAGPGANRNVYEQDGFIYDSATKESLGPASQFSNGSYSYVAEPKTVFTNFGENNASGFFRLGQQHTTVTQQTFESSGIQDLNNQINSQLNTQPDNLLLTINTINSTVNKDIDYYEPLLWIGNTDPDPNTLMTSKFSYMIQYRTLDNLVNNDYTVCFDKAVTEHLLLASQGIESQIVSNNKLDHGFLIVNIYGADYVVDPTKGDGEIMPLALHMIKYGYSAEDNLPVDSPLTEFE